MPTLRSQTASALKQSKKPSDACNSVDDSPISTNARSPCPGPATPLQEHESARGTIADNTPFTRRSSRLNAGIVLGEGETPDNATPVIHNAKGKRKAKEIIGQAAFCEASLDVNLDGDGQSTKRVSGRGRGRRILMCQQAMTADGELVGGIDLNLPVHVSEEKPNAEGTYREDAVQSSLNVVEEADVKDAMLIDEDVKGKAVVERVDVASSLEAGPSHQGRPEARPSQELQMEAGPSHEPQRAGSGRHGRAEAARSRFLQIARERASHFAHFDAEGDEAPAGAPPPRAAPAANGRHRGRPVRQLQPQPAVQLQAQLVDWPGPFSTARQLVNNRAMAAAARENASKPGSKLSLVDWKPCRIMNDPSFKRKSCPSLQELCLNVLANNADSLVSLEGVPELVRLQISSAICDRRKMNSKVLSLFFQDEPSEIKVPDCTQVTESDLTDMMKQLSPARLERLQLINCGRAISDQCLLSTIACPDTLTGLKSVSLGGAYRLTDRGLEALLQASPHLVHLDLSTCSFLTNAAVKAIAGCSTDTLESLVLDGCPNLNATVFVHDLVKLSQLQKLSLSAVGGVTDEVVSEICVQLGSHLKELVLAQCTSLTDAAIAGVAPCCPSLQVLNLGYLSLLSDVAIAHITDNLRNLQVLNFKRCKFSDEAIAAFVTASGGALINLSVNAVQQVANQTVLALAKHCHTCLESVDMSFCRLVDDECLGFLADSCPQLRELRLFGCTQVTEKFLNGHSNSSLRVVGLC